MKLRIALVPVIALAVIGLGAGLDRPAAELSTAAPLPRLEATPDADLSPTRRQQPLKVLPSVTVVPSPEERLAALGAVEEESLMLGAAVDQASAVIARPVTATLPRARLGNPFYDFARLRRVATE